MATPRRFLVASGATKEWCTLQRPSPSAIVATSLPLLYDCHNCPSYCCTYSRIEVTVRDVTRLARHFGVTESEARERYTKKGWDEGERVLKHQKDEVYGSACNLLDLKTRLCTVHKSRPEVCHGHPAGTTCGYYVFLMSERADHDDPDAVARAYNVPGEWPELEAGD
ncbi:MAG: YkgJ family cysteine cluster protein [Proteobacteria bacterium]|nr:YkgJ family cysteine cluster protein [Pseudomonadota bacterium]